MWIVLHAERLLANHARRPPSCATAARGVGLWTIVVGDIAAPSATPAKAKKPAMTIDARTVRHRSPSGVRGLSNFGSKEACPCGLVPWLSLERPCRSRAERL